MTGNENRAEREIAGPLPPLEAVLEAASAFLEADVLPRLEDALAFRMRILLRQLEIARRELALAGEIQAQHRARQEALLGTSGSWSELQAELARRIRARDPAGDPRALRRHLEESVRDSLRIDNPKWLADD